jgi:sugar/nucleoside kinase (ribokinase family)
LQRFDVLFLGNFTRDTIVGPAGTRTVNGGAFYYGANVACRLGGLRVAAVTRLAREDLGVVEELRSLGVSVFPRLTPRSTALRLVYPSDDPDQRRICVDSSAGPFSARQVEGLSARLVVVGASFRGEVGPAVLRCLAGSGARIALDVQGYVRVVEEGRLQLRSWPRRRQVLALTRLLKADAAEAEILTGSRDLERAARELHAQGPEEVLITHRGGVLVYDGGRCHAAPFHARQLLGRSGRGDTCLAAYACRRLSSAPAEATLWAAAVTSLKMEAEGPFRREPAEVRRLLAEKYGPG